MKCIISFSHSFIAPTHPKKKLLEQMMPTKQHPAEVMIDNKIQASPPNQYHSIRLKKRAVEWWAACILIFQIFVVILFSNNGCEVDLPGLISWF
jgi:hypothetical protein